MTKVDVVQTTLGAVRGTSTEGVATFLGIPYGEVGEGRRFQPPRSPQRWPDTRDATAFGPRAPQLARPDASTLSISLTGNEPMSEDCLTLNVWTPAADAGARPVMVWLHPGGFSSGTASSAISDGGNLARRGDVVVVSVNQRLSIFGYLYLAEIGGPAYADSGNAGQFDLLLALRWVRDNIAAFGGDPQNITLFGESGGGCKIAGLLTMPQAEGLFQKAIIQSGPMMKGVEKSVARVATAIVLDALGIDTGDISPIQSASTEALLGAYAKALAAGHFRTFSPVVDGRALPREPFLPDAAAQSDSVALMVGFTATETTLLLSDPANFSLGWDDLPGRLAPLFAGVDPAPIILEARALNPALSPSDLFFELTSQIMVKRNSVLISDAKAAQSAPVFAYEVNFRTPVDGGRWRSPHTVEIPLVFDNVERGRSLVGEGDAPQRVADQMSAAWIAFARTGDPSVGGAPWPRYRPADRQTRIFDVVSRTASNPSGAFRDVLKTVPLWHCTG